MPQGRTAARANCRSLGLHAGYATVPQGRTATRALCCSVGPRVCTLATMPQWRTAIRALRRRRGLHAFNSATIYKTASPVFCNGTDTPARFNESQGHGGRDYDSNNQPQTTILATTAATPLYTQRHYTKTAEQVCRVKTAPLRSDDYNNEVMSTRHSISPDPMKATEIRLMCINTSAEHKIGQYSVLPYHSKTYPGRLVRYKITLHIYPVARPTTGRIALIDTHTSTATP